MMADRYRDMEYFLGIDIKNEPHGQATWGTGNESTDWDQAAARAAEAVLAANPNILIFVQGIQENSSCSSSTSHWWGGNLEPQACYPLEIPDNKLVLSPHVYGPDVWAQSYFSDAGFPENMPAIWEAHFGFLADQGYVVAPGEFGGKYGHGGDPKDVTWQDSLIDYFMDKRICNFFYWSWNPNSSDTGGILQDDWTNIWQDKYDNLKRLMDSCGLDIQPACSDGVDNDGDGLVDMDDPGCESANDNDEYDGTPTQYACSDGLDNDGDGLVDMDDPGCQSSDDDDEYNTPASGELDTLVGVTDDWGTGYCADVTVTNGTSQAVTWVVTVEVGGTVTDLWNGQYTKAGSSIEVRGVSWNNRLEPGQSTSFGFCADRDEQPLPACSDGLDNDGDGLVDLEDPGCENAEDTSEYDSSASVCEGDMYKGCISGMWPEVTSVEDDEPWHHSRSTHYGLTYAGACGFGVYGLCTKAFNFQDQELQEKCDNFCEAYPDLCRDPEGTTLRGNFAAPQGNYYTQQWPSLSDEEDNYLSCGECFEVVKTKPDGSDYLPGQEGYQESVLVQISDSCPCGPNSKWCCGSGRNECGEVSHFEYGCPLPPGPPAPPPDHDPLPGESIHLDLSNIAMVRLQSGDANGTITEGVIPIRYRRVPCPVVGNIHLWLRTGSGSHWFSLNVVNTNGTGTLARVEAYRNPGPVYPGGPDLPGEWVPLTRDPNYTDPQERYGAWVTPNVSNVQPFSLPLSIRMTDFSNRTLTAAKVIKQWTPDDEALNEMYYIDTGLQFTSSCLEDAECDDGLWCNGEETCNPETGCEPGLPPDCSDDNACTEDVCDELADQCSSTCMAQGPEDPCCQDPVCGSVQACNAPVYQCSDGLDNDGDSLIDMEDPGCESPEDNNEFNEVPVEFACNDGVDNDGDSLIDLEDPGCESSEDDDEYNPPVSGEVKTTVTVTEDWGTGYCADVVVTNGTDGTVEWAVVVAVEGAVFDLWNGQYTQKDKTIEVTGAFYNRILESGHSTPFGFCANRDPAPSPACSDGVDNDGDGLVDLQDPGCESAEDNEEYNEPSPGDLTAEAVVTDDWGTGYCADIVIQNNGDTEVDWTVTLEIQDRITDVWNALYEIQDNTLTIEGLYWNNVIPAGGSISSVGFCAER